VAAGLVLVARVNSGQVLALNPDTGATIWATMLGSRVDTPPTIYKGLCFVGCHDGWVYALRAKDGALAYRTRIAPRERRMVAFGLVESVWPAAGAVLVHDGIAYATAGRTTESDGGIALVAFKPETGETIWAKVFGENLKQFQDLPSVQNGELAWHHLRMDLKTGKALPSVQPIQDNCGMLRMSRGFMLGKACDNLMAWNDKLVVSPSFAISRAKVEVPKPPADSKIRHPDAFKPEELAWKPDLEPTHPWVRVYAMALTGNAALFAGSVFNGYQGGRYDGSFLWLKSAVDGKKQQATIKLDARPAWDGLAVADGRVFLALQNGVLICWGK
jgi:outer membrane protein assembly factor BamB